MRIISGTRKGLRLKAPKGNGTRPVLDQVKEAIFNILPSPDDLLVLDLYAGTGALGIECLSRGAREAVFVEKNPVCARVLENLMISTFSQSAHLITKPVTTACRLLRKKGRTFDWIFCDPPYDQDLLNPTLALSDFHSLTHPGTRLIIEHSARELPKEGLWKIVDQRHYGQTWISFLKLA